MKRFILLFLFTTSLWAKSIVLITHYDAFGKAPFNNSERVAQSLKEKFKIGSSFELRLCPLDTVFDVAYAQIEGCLRALPHRPIMVLGLGETGCDMKIEMVGRNLDRTNGPDNSGNERNRTVIVPEGDDFLGFRYPLPHMYCALTQKERGEIDVSNNAGSFVCNNTAYQLSHYYPQLHSGFIHVPAHNCRNLERKTEFTVNALASMIMSGVEFLETHFLISPLIPHSSNEVRLPTKKADLNALRNSLDKANKCHVEFFKRARHAD